jgi:cell fate (sporulation/competence/biofilm development) regulator YlbF (YheA/YmcA/DUF963 family)
MSTVLETSVLDKTRELCEAIIQQPEFDSVRQRIDQFLINDAARQQYQELNETGEHLHHKQHQGVEISKEEIEAFEKKRQEFLSNPVARGFMEAQDEAFKMRDQVAKYVGKTYELGRVPGEDDFESECCNEGGCGCSH